MRTREITIGRVYVFTHDGLPVRVLKYGGGGNFTVKGPSKKHIPYNFAKSSQLRQPTKEELQSFIQDID